MSDVDAVIELLERWRDATGMARMRIGIDATRTIGALPPERKRALAIEIAERVAPQLVPAIEAESGDLTTQQVGAVVDLLRRADDHQLDDLVTALRSGDLDGMIDLVDDVADVIAPPEPPEPIDEQPLPEGPEEAADAVAADAAAADAAATGAAAADAAAADAEASATPPPPAGAERGAASAAVAAAAAALEEDDENDELAVGADGSLAVDEDAVRARLEAEAAQRAVQYRDSSRDVPSTPAYRAPEVDFTSEDLELPDPTVESVAPLHERMPRQPDRHGSRSLAAAPVTQVVATITATPDGYRRRRTALRMIREGRLESEDVAPVVRSFDRPTDRSWVAGAALDAGVIGSGSLEELDLSPAAVARLRRRAD